MGPQIPSDSHTLTVTSYLMPPNNKVRGHGAFSSASPSSVSPFGSPPSDRHEKTVFFVITKDWRDIRRCHGIIQPETANGVPAMAGVGREGLTGGWGR